MPAWICSSESDVDTNESTEAFGRAGGTGKSGCCLNQAVQRDAIPSVDVLFIEWSVEAEVVELSNEAVEVGNGTCTCTKVSIVE